MADSPSSPSPLPPGQVERAAMPRFGLLDFAARFPDAPDSAVLEVGGQVEHPTDLGERLRALPRIEQTSDFHCVTTWSVRDVRWSGFRFRDFYEQVVLPQAHPATGTSTIYFFAQDGYRQTLPLEDLLSGDVLLADRMEGAPLSLAHGAPLRLVAPAHYGFKNVKHLRRIECHPDRKAFRFPGLPQMDHPRARVAVEERASGWYAAWARRLYPWLVRPTAWWFRKVLARHEGR